MTPRVEVGAAIVAGLPAIPHTLDANKGFVPPADAPWYRVTFVDGAEAQAAIGGTTKLMRAPMLVYFDAIVPLGWGDGEATDLTEAFKDAVRFKTIAGARWQRFEQGPEGKSGADYRKQVVAVFNFDRRV